MNINVSNYSIVTRCILHTYICTPLLAIQLSYLIHRLRVAPDTMCTCAIHTCLQLYTFVMCLCVCARTCLWSN